MGSQRPTKLSAGGAGKDSIGFEITDEKRQTISLREIIDSPVFAQAHSPLTLALGTDIQGVPQIADLAKMPHLLVAGATGTGKSVFLNSLLISILSKATPEQVKLLLIDTKGIGFAPYATLPHLVSPVITDMFLAKSALEWATCELDSRYETMARLGGRDIEGFNQKLAEMGDKRPDEFPDLMLLPYLVIVIDEMANLMMTSIKDFESGIVRLAQLGRAAGIHMILATQYASADVLTGLIKANFPTRISFQLTSSLDSRTILDTVGAERLLGKGDMLYRSGGAKLQRLHGAVVDKAEIEAVVAHWESRQPQQFGLDFKIGSMLATQPSLTPETKADEIRCQSDGEENMRVNVEYMQVDRIECVWIDKNENSGYVMPMVEGSIIQNIQNNSIMFKVKEDDLIREVVIRWDESSEQYTYKADWYDNETVRENTLCCYHSDDSLVFRGSTPHELVYFNIVLSDPLPNS